MITKELIEDAVAAGLAVEKDGKLYVWYAKPTDITERIAKLVELQLQRQRRRQAVPSSYYEEIGRKYCALKEHSPPSSHPDFVDNGYADGWQELEDMLVKATKPLALDTNPPPHRQS